VNATGQNRAGENGENDQRQERDFFHCGDFITSISFALEVAGD
jgi:hypothetical protein